MFAICVLRPCLAVPTALAAFAGFVGLGTAAPVVRISSSSETLTIVDDGPYDLAPVKGYILYTNSGGMFPGWSLNGISFVTRLGSSNAPHFSVMWNATRSVALGVPNLTIECSDSDYSPEMTDAFVFESWGNISPPIASSATLRSYYGTNNLPWETSFLMASNAVGGLGSFFLHDSAGSVSHSNVSFTIVIDLAQFSGATTSGETQLLPEMFTAVESLVRENPPSNNLSSVQWLLTYADRVSGVALTNFSLVSSGLSGAKITSIGVVDTPPSRFWRVTANPGNGAGTLGLNAVDDFRLSAVLTNLPFVGEIYTIDRIAPDTFLTSPAPAPLTNARTFSVGFTGADTGVGLAGFEYRLNGSPYTHCASPLTVSNLSSGAHTLEVRALDLVGNADGTPVTLNWRVTPRPVLRAARNVVDGTIRLTFTNAPGSILSVLATTNISIPLSNWSDLGPPVELPGGRFEFTDLEAANNPQRYYRTVSP